jgi:hypothetical protein
MLSHEALPTAALAVPATQTARELLVLATMHKAHPYNTASPWLRPAPVGSFELPAGQGFSDKTGEHIAALNPHFCELTTQYWAWKNLQQVEHIGFCHYRRYLYLNPRPAKSLTVVFDNSLGAIELMSGELARSHALNLLRHADVIVPYPTYMAETVADHYRTHHLAAHWDVFTEVLFDKYPQYACFERYFEEINRCYFCNMAIWKWPEFDRYCSQLFDVMFEVYARVGKPEDPYQSRYIGFLAERFFSLYLYANALRAAEVATVIVG